MEKNVKYKLPDLYNEQQLLEDISQLYPIKAEPSPSGCIIIYDTFDWRLFDKSLVLYRVGPELRLRSLFESDALQQAKPAKASTPAHEPESLSKSLQLASGLYPGDNEIS